MEGQLYFVKVDGDDRFRPVYAADEMDAKIYAEIRFEWRMEINEMLRQIPNVVDLHAMFVDFYLVPVGCDDPEHTQDDGSCSCNECSMGEDKEECIKFRKKNKLTARY